MSSGKAIILILAIGLFWGLSSVVCGVCNYGQKAAKVVAQEIDPQVLLQKYEWFKDAAAQLNKKLADIEVYKKRQADLASSYEGKPRSEWAREDRDQSNLWSSEVAGTIASYNKLAADYNAQMAKINWRFCNVGDLPAGATEPLPREFAPYATE